MKQIPSERMSAVKGIGFTLHTEGTERYMDSEFDLVSGKAIDVDMINHVRNFGIVRWCNRQSRMLLPVSRK